MEQGWWDGSFRLCCWLADRSWEEESNSRRFPGVADKATSNGRRFPCSEAAAAPSVVHRAKTNGVGMSAQEQGGSRVWAAESELAHSCCLPGSWVESKLGLQPIWHAVTSNAALWLDKKRCVCWQHQPENKKGGPGWGQARTRGRDVA